MQYPNVSSYPSNSNNSQYGRETNSTNSNTRYQTGPAVRTISNGVPPKPPRQIMAEQGGAENVRHQAASASKPNSSSGNRSSNSAAAAPKTSTSPIYRRMPPSAKSQSKSHLIQELLECPVCFNLFENPHVLPCQHTYCKACINSLFDKTSKTLNCPICRVKHNLPNGVDSLTANFTIKRLIELESMEVAAQEQVVPEARQSPVKEKSPRHQQASRSSANAKCISCQRFTRLRVCSHCSYMLCSDCVGNPDHDYIIGEFNNYIQVVQVLFSKFLESCNV